MNQPTLWRSISVPESFRTSTTIDGRPVNYAGDVRIGSLSKPGSVDFLVYRSVDNAHDEGE